MPNPEVIEIEMADWQKGDWIWYEPSPGLRRELFDQRCDAVPTVFGEDMSPDIGSVTYEIAQSSVRDEVRALTQAVYRCTMLVVVSAVGIVWVVLGVLR